MIYSEFKGKKLSKLGFGLMRLPVKTGPGDIDAELVEKMIDYAIANGVNYFDTAFPYHDGMSEIVSGNVLKKYDRESFYLATKFPGHQISDTHYPEEIFEEQLKKCQVDYFDFYLLHNVCENSIGVYDDPKWGIIDYFVKQKELGRIKHLGFSTHAQLDTLKYFLDKYGDKMEFCQIQLNYLDWTLQDAKGKVELIGKYNLPVWVMEPVRGGLLARLKPELADRLKAARPEASVTSWAFRFLKDMPEVTMILSGMSDYEQVLDNIDTFANEKPLSMEEKLLVMDVAEGLKDSVPCTACQYCVKGCPQGLDIPRLISMYNNLKVAPDFNVGMYMDGLAPEKRPEACIACGKCAKTCPQNIDVPKIMEEFPEMLKNVPHWADICREREKKAKELKEGRK